MTDIKDKYIVTKDFLDRNIGWVRTADLKIPPIFAIDTAMLGVLVALLPASENWSTCSAIVTVLTAGGLLLSIVFLALVSIPRLSGPKQSIVYFLTAANFDENDFTTKITKGPTDHLIEDMASQAFRNAEIAVKKFKFIRNATIALFISALFWVIAISMLYVRHSG